MSEDQEQGRHRHKRADVVDAADEPKDEPDVEAHRHSEVLRDDAFREDLATGAEERGRTDEAL